MTIFSEQTEAILENEILFLQEKAKDLETRVQIVATLGQHVDYSAEQLDIMQEQVKKWVKKHKELCDELFVQNQILSYVKLANKNDTKNISAALH